MAPKTKPLAPTIPQTTSPREPGAGALEAFVPVKFQVLGGSSPFHARSSKRRPQISTDDFNNFRKMNKLQSDNLILINIESQNDKNKYARAQGLALSFSFGSLSQGCVLGGTAQTIAETLFKNVLERRRKITNTECISQSGLRHWAEAATGEKNLTKKLRSSHSYICPNSICLTV